MISNDFNLKIFKQLEGWKPFVLPTDLLQNAVNLVMKMVLRPQIDCLALVELLLVLVKSIVLENVDVFRDPFHHLIVNADAFQLKLKALLVLFQVFLRGDGR